MIELLNNLSKNELIILSVFIVFLISYCLYRFLNIIAVFSFLFLLLFAYVLYSTGASAFLLDLL